MKRLNFLVIVLVFFFWGFVAASNDILIPVLKEHLQLEQWQSQMVSFAFYLAYTVGSLAYFLLTFISGKDLLNRIGYRNGISLGLLISALGTLLFYPAAQMQSFLYLIVGLFIVGLGFSLQQIAANPLVINMGDSQKGSQRLSLAGGVNNIGTTIGPVLVAYSIFGNVSTQAHTEASVDSIKTPYLILGAAFVVVALIFKLSSLPDKIQKGVKQEDLEENKSSLASFPQLYLGMIAIFCYVGVEVATASNLPEFIRTHLGMPTKAVSAFVSLYWASLMIGRWATAAAAINVSAFWKVFLRFLLPYLAFLLFIVVNKLAGNDLGGYHYYAIVVALPILIDVLSKENPAKQLLIASVFAITALLLGVLSNNAVLSTYSFISVGLFCATLWPCIFTLALSGLGDFTNQGSSFLIMMIMGGGFISLLQGYLASPNILGIQNSYIVGVFCFLYLVFYAIRTKHILRKQGINIDKISGE